MKIMGLISPIITNVRGDFRTIDEKTDFSLGKLVFIENLDDPVAKVEPRGPKEW